MTRLPNGLVRCDVATCERNANSNGKNTGNRNLMRHLRRNHNSLLSQEERGSVPDNQHTISTFFSQTSEPKPIREMSRDELYELLTFILSLIIEKDLPFSFVESPALLSLMQHLNPRVQYLPSRQTVQRRLVAQYQCLKEQIKASIKNINASVSLTADLWTSVSQMPFIGITIHWINAEWKLQSVVLEICKLPNPHTKHVVCAHISFDELGPTTYNI
ncbi:hypothetical protein P9112_008050 [Eukaryota sp. TZLM1-RC]